MLALPMIVATLVGCGGSSDPKPDDDDTPPVPDTEIDSGTRPVGPPNFLVVLSDDQGVDQVSGWGVDPDAPATPTIDRLIDEGLRFDRAWVTPVCSSTRAALLTGRHGRRTLLASGIPAHSEEELALDEVTVAELLRDAGYATSAVGKWHLSVPDSPSGFDHPNLQGFDWFSGPIGNLGEVEREFFEGPEETERTYQHWRRSVNGVVDWETTYATTSTVDDALGRVAKMPEPWLLYVPFNAAHSPLGIPPDELNPLGYDSEDTVVLYQATVEAMDLELGRLLDGLGEQRSRTVVVFLSDNGTTQQAYSPDEQQLVKNTTSEGGIRVPMVVTGPGIAAGQRTNALVHAVNLLPTLLELAGLDPDDAAGKGPLDGVSFVSVLADPTASARDWVYTEKIRPNGPDGLTAPIMDWRIARDDRFKYVWQDAVVSLYDLDSVQGEELDLLTLDPVPADAQAAADQLAARVDALVAAMVDDLTAAAD